SGCVRDPADNRQQQQRETSCESAHIESSEVRGLEALTKSGHAPFNQRIDERIQLCSGAGTGSVRRSWKFDVGTPDGFYQGAPAKMTDPDCFLIRSTIL
ncbi:MAG: hypothetical protein ACK50J_22725, partial [Planctomyces sp.]